LDYLTEINQLALVCLLDFKITEQLPCRFNITLIMGAQFLNFGEDLVAECADLLVSIRQLLVELYSQLLNLVLVGLALLRDALDFGLAILSLLARLVFFLLGFGAKVLLDRAKLAYNLVPECGYELLHLGDVGFRDQRVREGVDLSEIRLGRKIEAHKLLDLLGLETHVAV